MMQIQNEPPAAPIVRRMSRPNRSELFERLQNQRLSFPNSGFRGNTKDVAVYYPNFRVNKRDHIVRLIDGNDGYVPYHVMNLPKPQADAWICQSLGAENLATVQSQLSDEIPVIQ